MNEPIYIVIVEKQKDNRPYVISDYKCMDEYYTDYHDAVNAAMEYKPIEAWWDGYKLGSDVSYHFERHEQVVREMDIEYDIESGKEFEHHKSIRIRIIIKMLTSPKES